MNENWVHNDVRETKYVRLGGAESLLITPPPTRENSWNIYAEGITEDCSETRAKDVI